MKVSVRERRLLDAMLRELTDNKIIDEEEELNPCQIYARYRWWLVSGR